LLIEKRVSAFNWKYVTRINKNILTHEMSIANVLLIGDL